MKYTSCIECDVNQASHRWFRSTQDLAAVASFVLKRTIMLSLNCFSHARPALDGVGTKGHGVFCAQGFELVEELNHLVIVNKYDFRSRLALHKWLEIRQSNDEVVAVP